MNVGGIAPGTTGPDVVAAPAPLVLPTIGSIICVQLGAAEFGLPIGSVREVLRTPPVTPVPFLPPFVAGVASVRGAVLPMVDLGVRLLGEPAVRPGRTVVVGGERIDGLIGLVVDAITGVIEAVPEAVQEAPPEAEAALRAGWVAGVISPEPGRLVTLLHLSPVLAAGGVDREESR